MQTKKKILFRDEDSHKKRFLFEFAWLLHVHWKYILWWGWTILQRIEFEKNFGPLRPLLFYVLVQNWFYLQWNVGGIFHLAVGFPGDAIRVCWWYGISALLVGYFGWFRFGCEPILLFWNSIKILNTFLLGWFAFCLKGYLTRSDSRSGHDDSSEKWSLKVGS